MQIFNSLKLLCVLLVFGHCSNALAGVVNNKDPVEIVAQCENLNHGNDHITTFSVKVTNRLGQDRQSIYKRYWKYYGESEVREKMTLFALAPADARNTAFMKVSFMQDRHKEAEQWLYMPSIRSLRAISRRDKNEAFLGSDLTYGDMDYRHVDDDRHSLLETRVLGRDVSYLIESVPRENDALYKRKVVEYYYSGKDQVCLKKNIHFYDRHDKLLKIQDFKWQSVAGVWLWDKVVVRNVHTLSTSVFEIAKPEVNTGLSEKWFSKRLLKRGI